MLAFLIHWNTLQVKQIISRHHIQVFFFFNRFTTITIHREWRIYNLLTFVFVFNTALVCRKFAPSKLNKRVILEKNTTCFLSSTKKKHLKYILCQFLVKNKVCRYLLILFDKNYLICPIEVMVSSSTNSSSSSSSIDIKLG